MKIHQIINSYNIEAGGAERLVVSIHDFISKKNQHSSCFGILKVKKIIQGCNSAELTKVYSFKAFISILKYFNEHVCDSDIVHSHLFPSNFYCSIIKLLGLTKARLITTEHSTSNRRRGRFFGKIIDYITYYPCDQIICISHGVKKSLTDWMPFSAEKIKIINNGIKLYKKLRTKKKHNKTLKIISVGSLRDVKNYDKAIMAMSKIKNLNFSWLIAGSGNLLNPLLKKVEKLKLEDKVFFLGFVDNVNDLLDDSDIFLIPSKWEGFGLSAVEAMHSSLPIIASDVDGLKQVVHSEPPSALYVDPNDEDDISDKVKMLLESDNLRQKLGKAAYEKSKDFSIENMLNNYYELYTK